jgi:hypothetical protein
LDYNYGQQPLAGSETSEIQTGHMLRLNLKQSKVLRSLREESRRRAFVPLLQ